MRPPLTRAILGAGLLLAATGAHAQPSDRPLPELGPFLQDVRARLHGDEVLLARYTFLEKHTERQLDGHGGVRKTTTETFEVYPSPEPGETYRKLVARDGRPLDAREIEKQDRKQDEKTAKSEAASGEKREARLAEMRRKEAEVIDELFRIYDIRMTGRETVDGRSAIVLTFEPRPDSPATTGRGKILKKFAGRAWIDEEDRQLVRLEGRLIDNLSFRKARPLPSPAARSTTKSGCPRRPVSWAPPGSCSSRESTWTRRASTRITASFPSALPSRSGPKNPRTNPSPGGPAVGSRARSRPQNGPQNGSPNAGGAKKTRRQTKCGKGSNTRTRTNRNGRWNRSKKKRCPPTKREPKNPRCGPKKGR
jgi:hypothetical protein